jgi:hypothetical protein
VDIGPILMCVETLDIPICWLVSFRTITKLGMVDLFPVSAKHGRRAALCCDVVEAASVVQEQALF